MDSSREDALRLMSKWSAESTSVRVSFESLSGIRFILSGTITRLQVTVVSILEHGSRSGFSFDVSAFGRIEYQDFRDCPPELAVALVTVECALWFRSDTESLVIHEERVP
jgi:hypothetical protein